MSPDMEVMYGLSAKSGLLIVSSRSFDPVGVKGFTMIYTYMIKSLTSTYPFACSSILLVVILPASLIVSLEVICPT